MFEVAISILLDVMLPFPTISYLIHDITGVKPLNISYLFLGVIHDRFQSIDVAIIHRFVFPQRADYIFSRFLGAVRFRPLSLTPLRDSR